jgi:hypothetical protein
MTFHDSSDFAPMVPLSKGDGGSWGQEAVVEDVARGEEFVQAGVSVAWLAILVCEGPNRGGKRSSDRGPWTSRNE